MDTISIAPALAFSELKVGMSVILMSPHVTMMEEWISAHTGTILTLNTRDRLIKFDFPNKESDKTPKISFNHFGFDKDDKSGDSSLYLIDALLAVANKNTPAAQQSRLYDIGVSLTPVSFDAEALAEATAYVNDMMEPIPDQPERRVFGIRLRRRNR